MRILISLETPQLWWTTVLFHEFVRCHWIFYYYETFYFLHIVFEATVRNNMAIIQNVLSNNWSVKICMENKSKVWIFFNWIEYNLRIEIFSEKLVEITEKNTNQYQVIIFFDQLTIYFIYWFKLSNWTHWHCPFYPYTIPLKELFTN